mgnify:CR=1 FL=1
MTCPEPIVGVHLDLKYMTASKAYLTRWIQMLPQMGINTLLIEYEDKFPYQSHPYLKAPGAFTPDELRAFLALARKVGLMPVPLVQTFSHLEFVFGHPQLAHLRELPDVHTQLDSSNPQATQLIKTLIGEVLAYHEVDPLFHLGGDETMYLGSNPRTSLEKQKLGTLGLWTKHISQFVDQVHTAGKRAIVWDDIFWHVTPEEILASKLDRRVMLHCWNYAAGIKEQSLANLSSRTQVYHQAGFSTIAGPCLNWGVGTPQHQHCLNNTLAWAITAKKHQMKGMINTAWSCFHVLPHAQTLTVACTGQMMKDPQMPDVQWQEEVMGHHFQTDAQGFVQAMQDTQTFWEVSVGLERPLTAILFGNMDMVLWFPDGHKGRCREGAYGHDIRKVDFSLVLHKKLEHLRKHNTDGAISSRLRSHVEPLQSAAATFGRIASSARANVPEALYYLWMTQMKCCYAQLLAHLLDNQPIPQELLFQWQHIGQQTQEILAPLVDEYAIEHLKNLWWTPMAHQLQNQPVPA